MGVRTARAAVALAVPLLILAGCGGSSSKPVTAQPGDTSTSTRTVEIKTTDDLKFDPPTVQVKKGEMVTFQVTNPSKIDREFKVGDNAFQEHHAEEMKGMGAGMAMPDDATGFAIKPGETKTIAFTFPASGTLLYGCHEPGHYPAGMKGEIKVT
ncbi:MAG: plastocyanin/azurin family copper-binding protein [Actinomycetota bacterium]|nr:plastocyanin/azurin family copper-binding protein [Actinomycetota bacterium]